MSFKIEVAILRSYLLLAPELPIRPNEGGEIPRAEELYPFRGRMEKLLMGKKKRDSSQAALGQGERDFSFASLRDDADSVPEFPLPRFQIRSGASTPLAPQ